MKNLKNKGFTAVELMLALALVAIITGIGLVNYFRQIPRYELREAGRDIVGRLRLLRQTAMTEGLTTHIDFKPEDGSYKYKGDEEHLPAHVRFGVMEGIDKATSSKGKLHKDGISFTGDTVSFKLDGLPVNRGTIYMTNAPFLSQAVAITVNFTGRVKLFKWNGHDWE